MRIRGSGFAVAVAVAVVLLSGCAGQARWKKSAEVVRESNVLVQRERNPEHHAQHPATVDGEALAEELCALGYVDKLVLSTDTGVAAAWPCDAAQTVAHGIADGLAEAAPDERVRFWVRWSDRDPSLAWFVPHERHTRGVAYWRRGGLELVFDRVGTLEGDTPRANQDPTERGTRRVRLVPPPRARAIEIAGKRQPMHLRWESLGPGAVVAAGGTDEILDPAVQARLDLLDELHAAGEIDDATYQRRRDELLAPTESSPP